jgi:hypothetical protein
MMNLRALAESDLGTTLEGEFSSTITLISPNGAKQTLKARCRWSQPRVNTETGEQVIVPDPVVEIRRSSISIGIPKTGEPWAVIMPDGPRDDAVPMLCLMDKTRAINGGKTLGTIKLPLVKSKQSEVTA